MVPTYRDLVAASGRWALEAFDRGWTPFPLSKAGNAKGGLIGCKAVLVKDWTNKDVTREEVESYAKRGTGLRMGAQRDGTIVAALDFDIPPADTAGKAWELFASFIGETRADKVLIRNGRKAKFCVLVRIDEASQAMRSPYYDRGGDEARLEVFANHSNQIGAQGVHSVYAETDEPAVMYSWDGDDPAAVAPGDLPLVTKAEISTFLTMFHDMMIEMGWAKRMMYEGAGTEGAVLFDLPEAVEAVVQGLDDGDRIRMLEITGEGESTQRGIVRHLGGDRVGVWDRNTAIMHLPARFKGDDESPEDKFARYAAKMKQVMGEDKLAALTVASRADIAEVARTMDRRTWGMRNGVTGESWEDMETLVVNMQLRYAHYPTGSPGEHIVDIFTGDGLSVMAFRQMMLRHAMELPTGESYAVGPKAGQPKTKVVNPVDPYLKDDKTMVIRGYQFDPSTDKPYVGGDADVGIAPKLNLYRPPVRWGGAGTDAGWFETFLEYLIPEEFDRHIVRNWVACKVQKPEMRGVGLVLVTPAMGTGRNVLIKLVRQMLGEQWCADVGSDVLMGTSGQSQYDDTMVNRLLITCDEIAMQGRSFDARMKAFERLKSVVDPYPQVRTLNRKGLSAITGLVHYSTLMASNHPYDALPLPEGDRRFGVIECTRQPFKEHRPDIKAIVDRVLPMGRQPDAAAMKGLWEYLMGLETSEVDFLTVPMTEVRRTMIEDGEGDVEDTIKMFLSKLPEDQYCFWFDDIVRRGEEWLKDRPNVRNAFKHLAKKRLRIGYSGWEYPNKVYKYVDAVTGETKVVKGVVFKTDAEVTHKERGRFLSGR